MPLDRYQLRTQFGNDEEWSSLYRRAFPLHRLIAFCVLPEDYEVPMQLADAVVLSERGEQLLDEAPSFGGLEHERKAVAFGLLGHDDLFVDLYTTDLGAIERVLSEQIAGGIIRYPFILG